MDYSILINAVAKLWWVIPIVLIISVLKTPWFKGVLGEASVKISAKFWLPESTYHRIHNVTLPTPDGTTQIDHIFVSRFGIFVVETKNMRGWIYGRENQRLWTQKIFKKSFKFQNPIRQNYKHVKALESLLGVSPHLIHSVVVFTGESTFKTPMPLNVTSGRGFIRYIKSFTEPVLTDTQVQGAEAQILAGRLKPGLATERAHIKQLRGRTGISDK